MSVIAIDCSRRGRLVCVLATESGGLLAGGSASAPATSAALPLRLAELLGPEVSALVAVNGPGSYTGLRAGLAAALGLAAARGLRVHVVGALEVPALHARRRGPVRVVADAGRGGVYTAVYDATAAETLVELESPRRLTDAELAALAAEPGSEGLDGNLPWLSLDPLPLVRSTVDAAAALAAAVPTALARPPIDPRAPPVVYLSATVSA
ncbi:MAG: tRNA (adenosine(37)-N6)-threonylcarbamoyltransferase complex dimerization subunit type 1 TsaB [Candidatus Dormibacteria bacterium]